MSAEELLSTAALFEAAPGVRVPSAEEVFAIDEEMRAFVHAHVSATRSSEAKLRRLLDGMQARGLFALEYNANVTQSARDTFHARQGNCLSFTILFVALAREAGLRVRYQMVDMPPVWSSSSDVVVVSNHINVAVRGEKGGDFVIDFNVVDFRGNYPQRQVGDDYALALFYTNKGAEALIAEDYPASFVWLQAAIETSADIAGPWSNLGLLYARHGLHRQAEAAYLQALTADPYNGSVLTNLVSLYQQSGDQALAEAFRRRVRAYQQRNPYYHYAVAQRAYAEQRFEDALVRLREALRLKRDEHQFYFLQALALHGLGHAAEAERSLARAREHAEYPDIRARYDAPVATLALAAAAAAP